MVVLGDFVLLPLQGAIDIKMHRTAPNADSKAIFAGPMMSQLLLWSVGRRCSNHVLCEELIYR